MKFVRTVIVIDQGNLVDSKEWATMHRSYVKALQGVVHPPGNDRFVIRKKTRKLTASGEPSSQWMRNGVVPIKEQFLANLKKAGWQSEKPVGLDRGSAALRKLFGKAPDQVEGLDEMMIRIAEKAGMDFVRRFERRIIGLANTMRNEDILLFEKR